MKDAEELCRFAEALADAARAAALPHFRAAVAVECKADASPVTAADRAAEKAMREMIENNYPSHGVIGEEFGNEREGAETVWSLDPIDGTRSFITGSPLFCCLIALLRGGLPVIGVIDLPALNERWLGVDANGLRRALFNKKPCAVSQSASLATATMITTTLGLAEDERENSLRKLCNAAGQTRLGGDGGAYGCVASGFADCACDYEMQPHDYLPLPPIVRAAGGVVSDWEGNENIGAKNGKTKILASASRALHESALKELQ